MRNLPRLLVVVFLAITLWRVAEFSAHHMRAGPMGWLFSVGLGVAVYSSAYWTRISAASRDGGEDIRSRRLRVAAWVCLVSFVAIDGFFNLQAVLLDVVQPELQASAWIYGLFPTCAAALLGVLQGNIDRLPAPPHRRVSIRVALANRMVAFLQGPEQAEQLPQQVQQPLQQIEQAHDFACPACSKDHATQKALNAHMRVHKRT